MSNRRTPTGRDAVHELEPDMRDRFLALDEPVASPDWDDVLTRAALLRRGPRRTVTLSALVALVVLASAIAVAPAMGFRLSLIDFWSAPAAPRSAESAFTQGGAWLPDSALRGLNLGQIRRISVEVFPGETERLFVAPRAAGGFCWEWAIEPGDPGIWADEMGGCAIRSQPLNVAFDDTRVSIVADRARIDRVTVTLSNGRVVTPSLRWVSAPVNAGFLLYQPPNHLHVVGVKGFDNGQVVRTVPVNQVWPRIAGS